MSRALFAAAALLWLMALTGDGLNRWVAATVLPPLAAETSVEVLARDGSLLRAFTVEGGRWRMALTAPVDRDFIAMLLAYEDRRFYRHAGVDPLALLRAAGQAVWHGSIVSGGSTLTMQVARLMENGGTGAWRGKLRQIRLALALERRLTKDGILGLYLLHAPYGGNLEGVRAAALAYFGKEPQRLTPAEAALLVALPQAPEARRPDRHPEAPALARARVPARLVRTGGLTADEAAGALTEPLPGQRRPVPALAPHLAERLRAADPRRSLHRTTIDAGLQARLEHLARRAVAGQGTRLSVALMVADHRTGEVLASVGSPDFGGDQPGDGQRQGFVDMTRALRSPGSLLKPLVYGLAFDAGLAHPETLIDDRPMAFGGYAPQNFDRSFRGTLPVRDALQLSLNVPVVMLTDALGPANLMVALRRAGVAPVVPGGHPGLAVALGGVGVTLADMVQLYAGIAAGGQAVPLRVARQAVPGDRQRILTPEAAWQVGSILAGLPPPPGLPANRLAYKTGTSYGHRDAWAIGFDGRHVAGVWMGRADGTPVPGAFGADTAARLKPALAPLAPPPPATLIVGNARLPPPLQRFRPRDALFQPDADAPVLAFPPDGAEVEAVAGGLAVKLRGGAAPFAWFADGVPLLTGARGREQMLSMPGAGYVTLSVIDAKGRAARARILLR